MATTTVNYSSNTSITFDISSLASSATFVAGRESSEIDNTTNKYNDVIVQVDGITAGATALTVGQQIVLYVWGSDTSLATTPIDTLDGTDSAETLTHVGILNALRFGGSAVATATTASLKHYIQPFSVASRFGGVMPKYWGLFLAHNHAGALAAAQSSLFRYTGIKYDIA